jgi:hypothetical protein
MSNGYRGSQTYNNIHGLILHFIAKIKITHTRTHTYTYEEIHINFNNMHYEKHNTSDLLPHLHVEASEISRNLATSHVRVTLCYRYIPVYINTPYLSPNIS